MGNSFVMYERVLSTCSSDPEIRLTLLTDTNLI